MNLTQASRTLQRRGRELISRTVAGNAKPRLDGILAAINATLTGIDLIAVERGSNADNVTVFRLTVLDFKGVPVTVEFLPRELMLFSKFQATIFEKAGTFPIPPKGGFDELVGALAYAARLNETEPGAGADEKE